MLIFTRRLGSPGSRAPDASAGAESGVLRLTYDWRQKSRCRVRVAEAAAAAAAADARGVRLAAGDEVGLDLPRGAVLRDGERIATDDGIVLRVRAAVEQLLQVRAPDALALTRIAYHLGNRHVPVQVGADARAGWLRLQLDHVLENMVHGLGGSVEVVSAPFDPEAGAYGHSHGSHAGHGHGSHAEHPPGAPARAAQDAPGTQAANQAHDATRGASRSDGHLLPDPPAPLDRRHAPRIHDFTDGAR